MAQAYMQSPDFDEKPADPRPEMSEDSATVVMLRALVNEMRLSNHIAQQGKGKVDWLKPPRTAMEVAEHQRRYRDHLSLAARLLPHKRSQLEAELSSSP